MTNGLSGPVFHSKVSVACPTSFPGFSPTRSRRTGKRKPWEQCGYLFDMYNLDPRVLFRPTGGRKGGGGGGVREWNFLYPLCGREMKDPGSRLPHALLWSTAHHWKQPHKQLSLNPKLFTLKLSHIINSQMFEIVHYVKGRGITKRLGKDGLICLQTSMYKYDYN